MFLALIHEGEVVRLPSGHEATVLGTNAGAVLVYDHETEEELEIMPQHLRAIPGHPQPAAARNSVLEVPVSSSLNLDAISGRG